MAVVAIAYLSQWSWGFGTESPYGAKPVHVYKVHDDGSLTFHAEGTYDGDAGPYGYELALPITPGSADLPRDVAYQYPLVEIQITFEYSPNRRVSKLIFTDPPSEQLIADLANPFPTPAGAPSFGKLRFVPIAPEAPVTPPFWTDLTGARERP